MEKAPVSELQEYCQKRDFPLPKYEVEVIYGGLFRYTVKVTNGRKKLTSTGTSTKKSYAKHVAAMKLLDLIKNGPRSNSANGNENVVQRPINVSEISEEELELTVTLKSNEIQDIDQGISEVFERKLKWQGKDIIATFTLESEN